MCPLKSRYQILSKDMGNLLMMQLMLRKKSRSIHTEFEHLKKLVYLFIYTKMITVIISGWWNYRWFLCRLTYSPIFNNKCILPLLLKIFLNKYFRVGTVIVVKTCKPNFYNPLKTYNVPDTMLNPLYIILILVIASEIKIIAIVQMLKLKLRDKITYSKLFWEWQNQDLDWGSLTPQMQALNH